MPHDFTHDRKRVGELLRRVREERGLRQVDVAEKLGQPQSYVSRIESAEQRADLPELRAVCAALGINLADFVRRFEERS